MYAQMQAVTGKLARKVHKKKEKELYYLVLCIYPKLLWNIFQFLDRALSIFTSFYFSIFVFFHKCPFNISNLKMHFAFSFCIYLFSQWYLFQLLILYWQLSRKKKRQN